MASLLLDSRLSAARLGTALLLAVAPLAPAPAQVGFLGPSFAKGSSSPSGSKPQHKLWWNDGTWWATLWDDATSDFYIFALDETSHAWVRTGTPTDDRKGTRQDVLWDDASGKLYVASHTFSESDGTGTSRLYRFTYDQSLGTYGLDGGFPATINGVRSETLVLAKDSTGQLWATWEQGKQVWVNRTLGGGLAFDLSWGTPFIVPGAAPVAADDIATLVAFGGDRIGVLWSDQAAARFCFAIHRDVDPDTTWQPIETAWSGTKVADDHLSLEADAAGRVFAAVKTSLTSSTQPLIALLARDAAGSWASHTVARVAEDHTRAILVLDDSNRWLRVYLTSPASGGTIYEKTSPIDAIAFPVGLGTPVIQDPASADANNAASTRQRVTSSTGLYVIATNDTTDRYWTSADLLTAPGNRQPVAAGVSVLASVGTPLTITLRGADIESCELAFARLSDPLLGTLGPIQDLPCVPGSPNQDSATIDYTPSGTSGMDAFTYQVTDDEGATSSPATVTITIPPPQGAPIVDCTFEGGVLVGPQGAGAQSGTVTLETAAPIRGSYSARLSGSTAGYLESAFSAQDDALVTFHLRLDALPASDTRIVLLSSQGSTAGNIQLRANGQLRLRDASTTIGSSTPLAAGIVYRIGLRQKAGSQGTSVLEAWLAIEDDAFGPPFAAAYDRAFTGAADKVRCGATTGKVGGVFDSLRVTPGSTP